MKIKVHRKVRIDPRYLDVENAPKRILIDPKSHQTLAGIHWVWTPSMLRARATITKKAPREMLHRFIARALHNEDWEEVFFANGDPFDCRFMNLRPYTREEQGAQRRAFKNNTSGFRGVSYKKSKVKGGTGRWIACIRVNGKLKHIGSYQSAEQAGRAYAKAARMLRAGKTHSL